MINVTEEITECFRLGPNYRKYCIQSCTLDTCPLNLSYWGYIPSLPANVFFLTLFAISLLAFLVQSALSRRFIGFSIAMLCGGILEVLGYVGRVWSVYALFALQPYLLQIICLTIAPSFYAAGIYLTLSHIITTFGPDNSRICPSLYPRVFIGCDMGSFLLQAIGGGLAARASYAGRTPSSELLIIVAGLAMQACTLLVFIALAVEFAVSTELRIRRLGREAALDPVYGALRRRVRFKAFCAALAFATVCVFMRSVYRVVELSEGWRGWLSREQSYFVGFEGAVVAAGVLALNVFHPGWCFGEGCEIENDKETEQSQLQSL